MLVTPWELWWDKRAYIVEIKKKINGREGIRDRSILDSHVGRVREERKFSLQHFETVSEKIVERERGFREESYDYKLKITLPVTESLCI